MDMTLTPVRRVPRAAAVLAVLALAATALAAVLVLRPADPFGGIVDPRGYQAVVLDSDRVYFGRLRALDGDFYELLDAHFLREESGRTRLVPIGDELHRPEGRILVRKAEVVIVENLRADSPILAEIGS